MSAGRRRMRWSPVSPLRRSTPARRIRRGCTTRYLGGKDNYAADREAVRQSCWRLRRRPGTARVANRAFLQRAVRFLVGEAGIRQIIDIGTGIPAAGNVHQVAGQIAPQTRVVYADNDPIVHVHANALLTGSGTTGIVLADLREPEVILDHPGNSRADRLQPAGRPAARGDLALHHRRGEPGPDPRRRSGTRCPAAAIWSCRMRPLICARKPRRTPPACTTGRHRP